MYSGKGSVMTSVWLVQEEYLMFALYHLIKKKKLELQENWESGEGREEERDVETSTCVMKCC